MRRDCQGPFLNDERLGTSYKAGTEEEQACHRLNVCVLPKSIC